MKTRDVVIGLIVLVVLISAALIIKNGKKSPVSNTPLPTPSFQSNVNNFPGIKIPANADRIDLKSVNGSMGMGEAFRTYTNGKFSLTIVANLPAYAKGHFYQGFVSDGKSFVSLGGLGVSKGGYIVNFNSAKDYSSFNKVIVTSETSLGGNPGTHILEGSF